MNSKIGNALIDSMFGIMDLQEADDILNSLADADEFVEWLGEMVSENEELAVDLLNRNADVVALVYEFLISKLDDSDAVLQYIKETAESNVYANFMCTQIDHDLEMDKEFTKILKDGLTAKVRTSDNTKLMIAYLNENPDVMNDILLWVLETMNIYVREEK